MIKKYILPYTLPYFHKQGSSNACAVYACMHALELEHGLKKSTRFQFDPAEIYKRIQQDKWGIFDPKRSLAIVEVLNWMKQNNFIKNYVSNAATPGNPTRGTIIRSQLNRKKPVIITYTIIKDNRIVTCHAMCIVGYDNKSFLVIDSLGQNQGLRILKDDHEITEAYCLFI